MRVRHKPGTAERLSFGGAVYEAVAPGRFEVPHDVGQALITWPDWEIDTEPLDEVAPAFPGPGASPDVTSGQVGGGTSAAARRRRRSQAGE